MLDDLPFLVPCSGVISRPSLVLFYSSLLPRNDNICPRGLVHLSGSRPPESPIIHYSLSWPLGVAVLCWMLHPSEYNLVLVVGQVTSPSLKDFLSISIDSVSID